MKLTEQEEQRITELLMEKIENATPEELEEAAKFLEEPLCEIHDRPMPLRTLLHISDNVWLSIHVCPECGIPEGYMTFEALNR